MTASDPSIDSPSPPAAIPILALPREYRFDVRDAAAALAELAARHPDTLILLTLAPLHPDSGIEEEQDVPMTALAASALLETVQEDQRVPGVSVPLYLLRVTRPAEESIREP